MSANVFSEDRQRYRDVGMVDFLVKPLEPEALFASVLRWLDWCYEENSRPLVERPAD
mgnify:FL=1